MTAEEARKLADSKMDLPGVVDAMLKAIKEQASKGKYELELHRTSVGLLLRSNVLSEKEHEMIRQCQHVDAVFQELTELGYNLKHPSMLDYRFNIKISWK